MGERGARNEPATPADVAEMARLVHEAVLAGAVGFSTSRTNGHRAVDGEPVPGTFAGEDELFAIGRALARAGRGVFEVAQAGTGGRAAGDAPNAAERELDWMRRLARETRRPVSFLLFENDPTATPWRRLLELTDAAIEAGAPLVPQIANRPFGMLVGHQTRANPFAERPTYQAIAALPLPERAARLRDPSVRARILAERRDRRATPGTLPALFGPAMMPRLFALGDPPDYEPPPERSVAAIAAREGRDPEAVLYDLMLGDDARELLLFALLNYDGGTLDPVYEMLNHPATVLGLGDGGAHCGIVCDATMTTFTLTHWARDRTRGPRLPLETAVRRLTADNAALFGFRDRGVVRAGMKADLNVIALDRLRLRRPEMTFDLPAGGRRLLQRADGYVATIVSGEVVMRDGAPTAARPGRVVRSTP
jgi:N-acyl-D-aspartate/D-glutamate deacylase